MLGVNIMANSFYQYEHEMRFTFIDNEGKTIVRVNAYSHDKAWQKAYKTYNKNVGFSSFIVSELNSVLNESEGIT